MATKAKILVIDDEEALCEILRFNLEKEGYEVDTALSAEEALTMQLEQYQLFIVDIMMYEMSGFDFARRLREQETTEFTPIMFCSALVGEDDKVTGLDLGADDYITKPFNIPEVKARVRAVLRRAQALEAQTPNLRGDLEADVVYGTLRIDRNAKLGFLDGKDMQLTRTEYDLLLFFLTHRGRIYSRSEIIAQVWGDEVVISDRTIDTNITRLRKKMGEYGNSIVTRQGFGYGFKEAN